MPIRRYIFNTLTVVSVLLLLATVGLWVDGTLGPRNLVSISEIDVGNRDDGVTFRRTYQFAWASKLPTEGIAFGGFQFWTEMNGGAVVRRRGVVPHWFLMLLFAIVPAACVIKWRRRRNLPDNACPTCTYDLTGNETGVCPECGAGVAVTHAIREDQRTVPDDQ